MGITYNKIKYKLHLMDGRVCFKRIVKHVPLTHWDPNHVNRNENKFLTTIGGYVPIGRTQRVVDYKHKLSIGDFKALVDLGIITLNKEIK